MKIKHLILTLTFAIAAGYQVSAQETDSANCAKYKSLYYEYLRQGMYRDAMTFWGMAYNYCGGFEAAETRLFVNGRIGYHKLMDEEKDTVKQAGMRDTLNWIYESLIIKDTENSADWKGRYASMLVSDKDTRYGKIDSLFTGSIHVMKCNTPSAYIHQYFKHLILNKFNEAPADKKDEVRNFIVEEYMLLSDYVSCAITSKTEAGDAEEVKRYKDVQEFMDKYLLAIVKDCETLVGVVDKKITALPQDKEQKAAKVKAYVNLLDKRDCKSTATYGMLMDTLISLDPTAEAYYITGKYYLSQDQVDKALGYFEKSVEMEGEGAKKNEYRYALAETQYKARKYTTAFKTAKTVGGEYEGKAMMLCGNAVAAMANDCGDSTYDRKANFWLANDYYRKAAALGENVSTSKFLDNAPTEGEIFQANKRKGDQEFLECWGESTTIR